MSSVYPQPITQEGFRGEGGTVTKGGWGSKLKGCLVNMRLS
jgi:hypothetical protein